MGPVPLRASKRRRRYGTPWRCAATETEVAGRREAREHALQHIVVDEAGRRALAFLVSGNSVQHGRHPRHRHRRRLQRHHQHGSVLYTFRTPSPMMSLEQCLLKISGTTSALNKAIMQRFVLGQVPTKLHRIRIRRDTAFSKNRDTPISI